MAIDADGRVFLSGDIIAEGVGNVVGRQPSDKNIGVFGERILLIVHAEVIDSYEEELYRVTSTFGLKDEIIAAFDHTARVRLPLRMAV